MEQSSENDHRQHEQVPQLMVVQPVDADDNAGIEEITDDTRIAVDPLNRYFSWLNIFFIIASLAISGFYIFEPQILAYFWKVYAPEETVEYLVNLKSCKIPKVDNRQSILPFLDMSGNEMMDPLDPVDFNCGSVDQFSEVDQDEEKLNYLTKSKRRNCCFKDITRPYIMENDMYRVSNCRDLSFNGTDVSGSEFLIVQCFHHTKKSHLDYNTHALIPYKPVVVEKILHWNSKYNKVDDLPFSVAVIVIASTSRAQAYRSLPETIKYLEGSDAQFTMMNGYQSMEENMPTMALANNNILPLISGLTGPSAVKFSSRWDNYSMLWTKFSKEKYVTLFMDDSRKMLSTTHGSSNGRYKAFTKQPTDYYLKPFLEATDSLYKNKSVPMERRHCFGKSTINAYLLQHLSRFHEKFDMIPTFSFSYLSWPQQQFGLEGLEKMDHTYLQFFKDFLSMPHILEKTAVVIMSDHGSSNTQYLKAEYDSIEKFNPLLMIRLPQKLVSKHPKYAENLKVNSHRIVSPIDVHRTISIFPHLLTEKQASASVKSGSTFTVNQGKLLGRNIFVSEIPHDRSCADAFIPDAMCLCNKNIP